MRFFVLLLLFAVSLVGCQTQPALPTQVDLTTATSQATPTRRTLPPTWTPSPPPTVIETATPRQAAATPTAANTAGTLYYIFNGDAIVKLLGDGSFEELIPIPHIGMGVTDLALSPDDTLLAYVASVPDRDSTREIYVTDREGNNTRSMTSLDYARVLEPTWRPDGGALVFLASLTPDSPLEIYIVSADGSGQRPLTQRGSYNLRDLTWSPAGDQLFFSDLSVYALDMATGTVSIPLTTYTGFGPDNSLAHHPTDAILYYIKPFRRFGSDAAEDYIAHISTVSLTEAPQEVRSEHTLIPISLRFSRDGRYLLIASSTAVWVQDQAFGTAVQVHRDGKTLPLPALSPNAERVAFVDLDVNGVPQVFTVARQGGQPTQITHHQEGTISDLVWAQG